ncbi:MAG TPA: hypothetical protein VIX58_10775, partial [Anaerolineae bacterium]
SLQRTVQVPSAFVSTLDGMIVVFVVATQVWAQRRSVRRVDESAIESNDSDAKTTRTPLAFLRALILRR